MKHDAKILIVDDEPAAIQMLRKTLQGMGVLCYATSGQEALDLVASDPPDLILLDANMPGMDGYDTCVALERDYPDIPVVFVTAAHDPKSEIRALEAGASDFITKPINPPVVRARVAMHLRFKAQSDLLRNLSHRDPLTGIANRRALEERLSSEWRRAARHQVPLSLLMLDVDHFKAYNDHYGHIAGDACLERVAEALSQTIGRAEDLVARYGGEEFAALLAGSGPEEALALAEKVRAAVRDLAIPHARSSASDWVSVSIGVASVQPGGGAAGSAAPGGAGETGGADESVRTGEQDGAGKPSATSPSGFQISQELFERADQALYAAKQAGRNRVSVNRVSG
jgi:diguanylate cyclase (GGDEF)-like protein